MPRSSEPVLVESLYIVKQWERAGEGREGGELGWVGLGRVGLGWVGLGWVGLC